MSVWDWVSHSVQQAYQARDTERVRLYETFVEAMRFKDRQPEQAEALLLQGRALALRLNEPWWILFYDHWHLQILIWYQRDFNKALDLAVNAAVETRKSVYKQFPQRICLHEDLINTYLGIDPEGYAPLVEQALEYMSAEVDPSNECVHCINTLRTELSLRLNRVAEAEDRALIALQKAQAENSEHHASASFCDLCALAYRRANHRALGEYAEGGVRAAFASQHHESTLNSLMWQAVAFRLAGDERSASRSFRTALARANQAGSLPSENFYDALCAYYEAAGEYEPALQARQRELAQIVGRGQVSRECHSRIKVCRLLKTMGLPFDTELKSIEAAAMRLKNPSIIIAEIAELRSTGEGT